MENYVVNAFPGKPIYVYNDYEKKDEAQDKKKYGSKEKLKETNSYRNISCCWSLIRS